ncbi:hypothetical protein E2R68_09710 [Psychromonas sp. RZ22]|uniref:hypothetical protein n=1 Tax=Psychromonas algarum TaxID=2555643 RepID=UPI0010681870|nr:hypothetical protein [Psychromonas sp. RZ22]TEW54145.1 hypothetical protein E2R68_09710 [Psychromonas sp. RZ22]
MLIFYIICGVMVFAISGLIFQYNRLAIYRRRIIRHLATTKQQTPFVLTQAQEQQIKQCFLKGVSIQQCINQIEDQ